MAMVDQQLDNFVQKFRELWAKGLSAHLDLECGGGEAWVGLRLQLGRHRAGGEAQQEHRGDRHRAGVGAQQEHRGDMHRRGPSYARRLARRAANRTAAVQAGSALIQAEQVTDGPAHEVGEGVATTRGEGDVVTTDEVVETVDDIVEEATRDAAVPTMEVVEAGDTDR